MVTPFKRQSNLTVILNIWKRNHVEEQVESLLTQTVLPQNIWIIHYDQHVLTPSSIKNLSQIQIFNIPLNLKYFGRYSLAQHCQTTYTWVLDDDVIPSSAWIERAVEVCESSNAIVCSNGRLIPKDNFFPERAESMDYINRYFVGDSKTLQGINLCKTQ